MGKPKHIDDSNLKCKQQKELCLKFLTEFILHWSHGCIHSIPAYFVPVEPHTTVMTWVLHDAAGET